MERSIIDKIFESRNRINEASFESGGSHYSTAFGRYSKDGQSITRDEYFQAKSKFNSDNSEKSIDTSSDESDWDISAMSKTAGSKVKNGKDGPYYYDNGDMESFDKSVSEMTDKFKEKYEGARTVNISKDQTVTYDEESGYAVVTKKSTKPGKSWTQYKKLTDKDKELITKANTPKDSEPQSTTDSDEEDLVVKATAGDKKAEETLIKNYEKMAYHLSKGLFLPGGSQDDLVQEALIGLVSAIRDYKPGKNKNFKQFAILAMKRNMQDAIRSANRQKNAPLNKAEDYETSLATSPTSEGDPEQTAIEKSDKERLVKYMKDNLTDWEQEVLSHYLRGYSYDEIAGKTKKNNKAINNAMNKIRSKMRAYKSQYQESKLVEMIIESLESSNEELMLEAYYNIYS